MTSTNHQCAYLSALDAARGELDEIVSIYNHLLLREEHLKVAVSALESCMEIELKPSTEKPAIAVESEKPADPAYVPLFETPAPAPSRIERFVGSAPRPKVSVQEEPADPILRRIHNALDLVSVA